MLTKPIECARSLSPAKDYMRKLNLYIYVERERERERASPAKALLSVYYASIKALLRLYCGAIRAY